MVDPTPQTPGERRPPRGSADPLQMSVAEKLACEWEARHDVVARGLRPAAAAPVQDYLTHTRCEDHQHPSAPHRPRPSRSGQQDDAEYTVLPLLRGWLSWEPDTH